ncbi:MAG: hypothetical protein II961_06285 [Candidatus Riflebacteria bacterium]|nr:hypothetical protein [Candidatus Riflebacteria bacterium]
MGFLLQRDKKTFKLVNIFFIAFLIWNAIPALAAEVEFFPVKELQVGMKGFGKTVVSGRKIEKFDVEILGICSNNKINESALINGKSILVKVSGDVIKKAGGIAAGMSGSPIYIDNKLVGGISSGWLMTDHTVGLVTPIEEMLEIWNYPSDSKSKSGIKTGYLQKHHLDKPVKIGSKKIDTIIEAPYSLAKAVVPQTNEVVFSQAATEIRIDDINKNRVSESIKARLNRKNVIVTDSKNNEDSTDMSGYFAIISPDYYEPGSSIGIQLARGDINVTTLGTLTHREGERILGLAHSFLKKGNVSFLLTGAYIHHSFGSVQMPFKIGAPTEMLGTVEQDREKGISAVIGKLPTMIPVKIDVNDKTLGIEKSINYQIVKDASILSTVLDTTIMQALEGAIDREGPGTALMSISMDCSSKKGENYNFRRENLFYSKTDICQVLTNEVTSLVDMISESEFDEVLPTRILLKIEIENKRRTLTIEKVEVKNSSVSSGGVLDVEVTLKPFREPKFIRKVKLPIPQDIGKESLTLSVFGLNMKVEDLDIPSDSKEGKTSNYKLEETNSSDFSSVIRSWASAPKNSDILFQITVEGDENKKLKMNNKDYEIQPTNLVVTGRVDTTLTLSEE